ncbi:MAG: lactate utilization protein [Clostridium sp.]|nr:lactate utilization protein [Clostridium sp.]
MEKNAITGLGPVELPGQADVEAAIKNFEGNGFAVRHFATAQEAADFLDKEIHGKTVGFGDSHTLIAMRMAERLAKHNYVIDPNSCVDDLFGTVVKKAMDTEIFLTSVNGASETGELVNIDSSSNRVAGSLFGHEKVYYVFSVNKITPTLEQAIWRARNIAAPINAKRLGFKTPCAVKGDRCYNCKSPDRICNKLVIYMKHGKMMKEEIVLIDEPLGF